VDTNTVALSARTDNSILTDFMGEAETSSVWVNVWDRNHVCESSGFGRKTARLRGSYTIYRAGLRRVLPTATVTAHD
jgi:hypothetical protein